MKKENERWGGEESCDFEVAEKKKKKKKKKKKATFVFTLSCCVFSFSLSALLPNGEAQIGPPGRAGGASPLPPRGHAGAAVAGRGGEVRRKDLLDREFQRRWLIDCNFVLSTARAFLFSFSSFSSSSLSHAHAGRQSATIKHLARKRERRTFLLSLLTKSRTLIIEKPSNTLNSLQARPPRPRARPEAAPARLEAPADRVPGGQGHHVDPGEEARGEREKKERELNSFDRPTTRTTTTPLTSLKKKKNLNPSQLKSLPVDHGAPSASSSSSPLREVALRAAEQLRAVPSWDRATRRTILAAAADEAAARAAGGGGSGGVSSSAPSSAVSAAAIGGGGLVEAAQRAEEVVLMQALARARAASRAGGGGGVGGTAAAAAAVATTRGAAARPQQQWQQQPRQQQPRQQQQQQRRQ